MTRTHDLLITNQLLYRLSYTSTQFFKARLLYQRNRALSRVSRKEIGAAFQLSRSASDPAGQSFLESSIQSTSRAALPKPEAAKSALKSAPFSRSSLSMISSSVGGILRFSASFFMPSAEQ